MTTITAPLSFLAAARPVAVHRMRGLLAVVALFLAGWLLLAQQHAALWQRLPVGAVDRFVADQVTVELPPLPSVHELVGACAQAPSAWAGWRRAQLRQEMAACLSTPEALVQAAAADQAEAHYRTMVETQVAAAQRWLTAFERQSAAERSRLVDELKALQATPAGGLTPLARMAQALGLAGPTTPSEAMGRTASVDTVAVQLRSSLQATQLRLQALSAQPMADRLPALALLATGLKLATDFRDVPPLPYLVTDRASLAEALEWQRRSQGFARRGFSLASLQALPAALWASSLLVLAMAALGARGRWAPVLAWAAASVLLGVGALVLTDLALTGDPSMRYLAERQFLRFGMGDSALNLTWAVPWGDGRVLTLWWPLLTVVSVLGGLANLRDGCGVLLSPVRGWVRVSVSRRWGWAPALALLLVGAAMVLLLGMPAAVSELLILLGVVGMASYLARQAAHANTGAGLAWDQLAVVAVALACAMGGALLRGDLGHALVALMLACVFAWMFGDGWLRWLVAAGVLTGVLALGACLAAGELVGPLTGLTEHLPPHAQDRMRATFNPFEAAASDLARVRWLMDSAGVGGWGAGYVPWQGLALARLQDGLPLQGPSDYVLALVSALWGRAGGLALITAVLALFVGAGALGLRTALRPAMPSAVRWLAAVGGFGCLVMAFKVTLSVGGVAGVLPLTGLPVALIGYGPVTHLMALLYLCLGLGACHLHPAEASRGVDVRPHAAPAGAVRRRGLGLAVAGLAGVAGLLFMGERHLSEGVGEQGQRHVSRARLELAQALTGAMVAAEPPAGAAALPCEQLGNAVAAWNQRLARLSEPVRLGASAEATATTALRLDGARLWAQLPPAQRGTCPGLARTLGQMLETDLPRLVGRAAAAPAQASASAPATEARRQWVFERPRALGARPLDYATANAWWGQPGCLYTVGHGEPGGCPKVASATPRSPAGNLDSHGLTDVWLQRELAPTLFGALRQPVGQYTVNYRRVPNGPALGLTLDGTLQPLAQRVADCFTGRLAGEQCSAVMPRDPVWRERHFSGAGAFRASALGLVLVEVESGRVVALAGAVSDCTLDHLGRAATADAQGRVAALPASGRCAQLPDQRSAWLASQHPALWMLPPGSSLKELALVAGMDAGLVAPGTDAYWTRILAESHERLPIQRIALGAGQHYLDVLHQLGYGTSAFDLVWGGPSVPAAQAPLKARWSVPAYAGSAGLRASTMGLDEAERIRHEKLSGVNVDKRYGHAVMSEFVAARSLADAALGGGDIRVNALGLARLWRGLDLQARGQRQAADLHLVERAGQAVPTQPLTWASPQAARRALGVTSGVSASDWHGTAQGSCRVVFGACPTSGLPTLSGKTGSSDFLTAEDGPFVKPGLQLPAKLFGGVFTGANGQRYAVAVTALRVREGSSRTLELTSSAPAEAALTLMREMGVRAAN